MSALPYTSTGRDPRQHSAGGTRPVVLLTLLAIGAYAGVSPVETAGQLPGEPHATAQAPVHPEYRAAVHEARELVLEFMAERGAPGLAVAVAVEGDLVWSEGFGYANVEHRVPVTPLTRFRSGSTAKPFTAAAIGILVERGELDLDEPVQAYVPHFPEKEWPVTTRQLAGHLAGIRHYPDDGDEFLSAHRYTGVDEALEIFQDDPLLFEPGTDYSYSSYGWNLISAVIEGASGRDFLELMHEEVFRPLNMVSTLADHSDSIVHHRVSHYERTGGAPSYRTRPTGWGDGEGQGALFNAPYVDNSNKWAGGGFLTNPVDLVRFGSGHLPGADYHDEDVLALLHTSMVTADGEETGYGIGWRMGNDVDGRPTVGHGGGSVGGTTSLLTFPESGVVVAIQANLTNAQFGGLPSRVAELFHP
jgi:serine beta-lactamase-like protein LACTB, mitochondrial